MTDPADPAAYPDMDGIGFDVDALREATPAERTFAESQLDATRDWRDVEALAVLAFALVSLV